MKRLGFWAAVGLAGLLLVFLINTTPLARFGIGIELPFGWQNTTAENINNCRPKEYSPEGIPFSNKRVYKSDICTTEFNKLATILNGFSGIGFGIMYTITAEKRWWPIRKSRNSNSQTKG